MWLVWFVRPCCWLPYAVGGYCQTVRSSAGTLAHHSAMCVEMIKDSAMILH